MSFAIETDNLLGTLWDNLRPDRPSRFDHPYRPQDGEVGLLVTLDLTMSHYAGENEYHRSALVYTVFTANTSVFVHASRDFKRWQDLIPEDWANMSNHDSCWRTDGLRNLHLLQGTFAKEMNEEIVGHGNSPLAPREFGQFCSLGGLAQKPWRYVDVAHERIPDNPGKRFGSYYRRRILSIQDRVEA